MIETKKTIVTDETTLTGNSFEEIELREEGCLKILADLNFRNITINKLINNKRKKTQFQYDILIISKDGDSGSEGSGDDGKDGQNAGEIVINIIDLVDDVKIYIKDADGGNGGSARLNGNGGNGGKGGDGANITFNYGHVGKLSNGIPYYIRTGGNGGNGGLASVGIGGRQNEKPTDPTYGGKNGNGGKAGKKGSISIHKINNINTRIKEPLDLNNDEEYNYFLKHFGGEETIKKYPKIWNSIQKSRNEKKTNEDEPNFHNSSTASVIQVTDDTYDNNESINNDDPELFKILVTNVMTEVNSNTNNELSHECVRVVNIYRYNEKGDKVAMDTFPITTYFDKDEFPFMISDIIPSPAFNKGGIYNQQWIIETRYMYTYKNQPCKILPIYKTTIDEETDPLFHHIEITEPHYKANPQNQSNSQNESRDIKFLYGREYNPQEPNPSLKDADYHGNEYGQNAFDGEEIPTTIVPIAGKIVFHQDPDRMVTDVHFASYVDPVMQMQHDRPYLTISKLENEGQPKDNCCIAEMLEGVVDLASLHERFEKSDDLHINKNDEGEITSVDFNLVLHKNPTTDEKGPYDWKQPISKEEFVKNCTMNFCFLHGCIPIEYVVTNKKSNSSKTYTFYPSICGTQDLKHTFQKEYFIGKKGNKCVYIPRMVFIWGCFAADTIIKTTNGEKKASEIKRGDKLPVYGGKILTISAVYVGEEKSIYNIKTTDKKSIKVSGGHAMKLYCKDCPDGKRVSAVSLKKGDLLMTPEKVVEVESVDVEAYNDKVYNFEFEEEKSPNYIKANGFWSGDLNAQNKPEKRELSPEAKELAEEMKKLVAELAKNTQN